MLDLNWGSNALLGASKPHACRCDCSCCCDCSSGDPNAVASTYSQGFSSDKTSGYNSAKNYVLPGPAPIVA